jgi:hypothetical protein
MDHGGLADSDSQSIDGIPDNVSYIYRDHNLKSTGRIRFQVDTVNERLWIVDIAPSKTPKTLGDRHINGLSVRHCTALDWDRPYCLGQRCVASVHILLILLELEFNRTQQTEDVVKHRSLWSNRPRLYGVIHSSSDAGWVGTTEVWVCIWDD